MEKARVGVLSPTAGACERLQGVVWSCLRPGSCLYLASRGFPMVPSSSLPRGDAHKQAGQDSGLCCSLDTFTNLSHGEKRQDAEVN